jgi:iron complex outermembrane receptor protein
MDLAVFYNVYDNLATLSFNGLEFETPPLHAVFPILTTNRTNGEAYGFEAVVNWRALDNLDLSLAYSYLEIQLHGPSAADAIASEGAEGQSPQNQLTLRAEWDVTSAIAFDTALHYTDELPNFGVDAYWQFDARFGWRVIDQLTLELVGQNLFDETHREFGTATDVGTTDVPRSFYGRLTWRS